MIKCILFDLGGVTIDYSDKRDYAPYLSHLSGMGIDKVSRIFESKELERLETGKMSQARFTAFIAESLSVSKSKLRFVEFRRKTAKLNHGVARIAKLASRSYTVAYLTNESKGRYADVRRMLKPLDDVFSYRFASCYLGLRKPDARIYRRVLSLMGLEAGEVVFVDNAKDFVVGARKVGIKSILFTGSKDLEKKLRKMGIKV